MRSTTGKLNPVLLHKNMYILFPVSLSSYSVLPLIPLDQKMRTCLYLIHVLVSCYSLWPLSEVLMEIRVLRGREIGLQIRDLKLGVA